MGYITHRLVIIIPTLLGASLMMFVLTMLIPGDPALLRLGNFATTEQLQHMREEMGLTKPPLQRYLIYLWGLVQGDDADQAGVWREALVSDRGGDHPDLALCGPFGTVDCAA
jgi:peptide/nickel transport system permease protein